MENTQAMVLVHACNPSRLQRQEEQHKFKAKLLDREYLGEEKRAPPPFRAFICCTTLTPALRRQRERQRGVDLCEFQDSQAYIVRCCHQNKTEP